MLNALGSPWGKYFLHILIPARFRDSLSYRRDGVENEDRTKFRMCVVP